MSTKARAGCSFYVVTRLLVAAVFAVLLLDAPRSRAIDQTKPAIVPNRVVPKVSPPPTGLEIGAHSTSQEISRVLIFEERLVPIGGEPNAEANAALVAALLRFEKRTSADDFGALTGFLDEHPQSPWRAALLTCLGIDYYRMAYYSRALKAWQEAWSLAKTETDPQVRVVADRALCELAALYCRLGRITELDLLLDSVRERALFGTAAERIHLAHEALSLMKNEPGTSFRCGPLALQCILLSDQKVSGPPGSNALGEIFNARSTRKGTSLPQVAELSKRVGLNYQMAFRQSGAEFVVPCVVNWKVGHYAALVRRDGERYLLEDPTFGNTVWATRRALEAETSGYFLVPPGPLPRGWRNVGLTEGGGVWGRGVLAGNDTDSYTKNDLHTGTCQGGVGMAVPSMHLMLANLQVKDTPVGYTPPVGPPVWFTVRFNYRDSVQRPGPNPLGPNWTHDWAEAIMDNPNSPLADVKYIAGGGGARTFSHFDASAQTFAPNQYDYTLLKRTGTNSYEMSYPDGSKKIFGLRAGGGSSVLLTQVLDPAGNAVTLSYDQNFHLVALTDAIGQVTTLTYGVAANQNPPLAGDPDKLTKVTDPFGRAASFDYLPRLIGYDITCIGPPTYIRAVPIYVWQLSKITDTIGLTSVCLNETKTLVAACPTTNAPPDPQYVTNTYSYSGDLIAQLVTPYGSTYFSAGEAGVDHSLTRSLEIVYPDGSRERMEFIRPSNPSTPDTDPVGVPVGMAGANSLLDTANTYYWSRTAEASSHRDYSKAKIFHWKHANAIGLIAASLLDSIKEPLEGRLWFEYSLGVSGLYSKPIHVGRVLDDGQTQLYSTAYNDFGHLTNSVDPLGRTLSFVYATNGIDLLEVRQTRAGKNELLFRANYNTQHRPVVVADAAGQTDIFTYNARGQRLTATNPKGETTSYGYDTNGYLIAMDGPLSGTNDTSRLTYDPLGRVQTMTTVSGYTIGSEYDDMNRVTRMTHPDGTFEQFIYNRLDMVTFRDRAGRQTSLEYDPMRRLRKRTDPMNRVTLFDWCRCGQLKSLTDPMGRTTTWLTDVQGRPTTKQYADGSQVTYVYESTTSRRRLVIDEKQQVTQFTWNRDNSLKSIGYGGALLPTPGVNFEYDPDYNRIVSITDCTGTTRYSYNPVTAMPSLGAGALASVDGPVPDDTITYSYDELGRPIHNAINGVDSAMEFDAAGRLVGITNALGAFTYSYDGASGRLISKSFPNGQTTERSYGNHLQDLLLERITHKSGATPISEFLFDYDIARGQITTWSQQAGAQSPDLFSFGYDDANQLLSATVSNAGNLANVFAYSYDPAGNRLTEQVGALNYTATYNGLNEIRTTTAPGATHTNEWDAVNRLVAVSTENQRTEFTYDGASRMVAIRKLVNGSEVSLRRFVWCGSTICEERDGAGAVRKRFFPQGVKLETGPNAGAYFYTRDHLGSIRELTDASGNVRARYSYDPYGRRTKLAGDMDADFGFAGMFFSTETSLSLTHYRAYDASLGRWLSRDPLRKAEMRQGPNLYAYVRNEPISSVDPSGLIDSAKTGVLEACAVNPAECRVLKEALGLAATVQMVASHVDEVAEVGEAAVVACEEAAPTVEMAIPAFEAELPDAGVEIELFIEEGEPVATETLHGVGPVGDRARFIAEVAERRAVAAFERFQEELAARPLEEQWWWHTLQATRQWRQNLPDAEQIKIYDSIFDTAQLLFGR